MPPPRRPKHPPADAAAALARVALLTARWCERLLAPLTVAQYLALQAAARGDLAAGDLARATGVSPAAVSQLLAALEDDGLVRRARAAADRRRQTVEVTARGRAALRAAEARVSAPLTGLLAGLGPREADALRRGLPPLADLLTGTVPPPRPVPPPGSPRPPRPRG